MIMKTENRNGNQRNTKKNQNKNETAKKLQGLIKDIIHSAYEKAVEKDRFNPMFRQCGKMPDEDFFFYCVMRAMEKFESGRAFLQILSLKKAKRGQAPGEVASSRFITRFDTCLTGLRRRGAGRFRPGAGRS